MTALVLPRAYDADRLDSDLEPIDRRARRLTHDLTEAADWLDELDPDLRNLDRRCQAIWREVTGGAGGFKTFVALDPLYAADVMDFLMRQAIAQVTSGTRPSSPVEGQPIYETDTDARLFYDGSAWKRTSDWIPHSSGLWFTPGGARTTASTSYINWATDTSSFSLTKYRADTSLQLFVSNTRFFHSGAGATNRFALLINGTDYEVVNANPGAATEAGASGERLVTGIAAGVYTVQLRVMTSGATFTYGDGGSRVSIRVTETL